MATETRTTMMGVEETKSLNTKRKITKEDEVATETVVEKTEMLKRTTMETERATTTPTPKELIKLQSKK